MKQLLDYKCPHCGGNITFDINTQHMKCPYCSSEFSVTSFASKQSEWTEEEVESLRLYTCNSCGGEVAAEPQATTAVCPFCDSDMVIARRVSGKYRPDYIIPFKLDKAAAIAGFKKQLRTKKLLPKIFKSDARICECRGVYVPFWLFSADYRASAVVRGETGGKHSKTVYFDYDVKMPFRKLPVDACKTLPNDITESLEPYDFEKDAVPFAAGYLAGYCANMYDENKNECIKRVAQRMNRNTKREIYDHFIDKGYLHTFTKMTEAYLSNHSSLYALYPVWLINARWKNKRYTFAMNGQTGKFVGNLPCSNVAATGRFFATLATALGIGMLITLFIWWFIL